MDKKYLISVLVGWLCWGLTSQSTIFQSYRDGAIASWVINQYFRGVKCLAQGHNTAAVGLEPRTSRSGVRHSTTEPPRSPSYPCVTNVRTLHIYFIIRIFNGCELRIENSVTTVIVRHGEVCRVMPNSYPEWRGFQFAPNNHYGFFFLHTLPSTIAFRLEYVFICQFYAEQK